MAKHKIKKCPKCDRERPSFTIRKNGCDVCRTEKARESHSAEVTPNDIKAKAKKLLAQTDYWDNVSYRARKTKEQLAGRDQYRNTLRDITKSCDNPSDVVFPKKPK